MTSSALTPHLDFLTNAAHILSSTSPETSAYIMSSQRKLMFENDIDLSDAQKQHACTCCGHIMVPGHGTSIQINAAQSSKRKHAAHKSKILPQQTKQSAKFGPSKVFTCGNCGRYTKFTISKPKPITRRKPTLSSAPATLARLSPTEAQKPSANASSKKRAKNRKAGLQALLDQNKSAGGQHGSGLGFSLSDFMKK